jgi:hypothetical protein
MAPMSGFAGDFSITNASQYLLNFQPFPQTAGDKMREIHASTENFHASFKNFPEIVSRLPSATLSK